MGVTDIGKYRDKIRDTIEKESEDDSIFKCPNCDDMLYMMCSVPEYTKVDEGGPYAIICQHCSAALGSAYLFNDDEEEKS